MLTFQLQKHPLIVFLLFSTYSGILPSEKKASLERIPVAPLATVARPSCKRSRFFRSDHGAAAGTETGELRQPER